MNRIERVMVFITMCIVGRTLPISPCGVHLRNGKVVDEAMALTNLNHNGHSLANLIDGKNLGSEGQYPVKCRYLEPLDDEVLAARDREYDDLPLYKHQTKAHWVGASYHLQLTQCLHPDTCPSQICKSVDFKSNLRSMFPMVQLPPPLVFDNETGEVANTESLGSV